LNRFFRRGTTRGERTGERKREREREREREGTHFSAVFLRRGANCTYHQLFRSAEHACRTKAEFRSESEISIPRSARGDYHPPPLPLRGGQMLRKVPRARRWLHPHEPRINQDARDLE
jgi:hypothetical protein